MYNRHRYRIKLDYENVYKNEKFHCWIRNFLKTLKLD